MFKLLYVFTTLKFKTTLKRVCVLMLLFSALNEQIVTEKLKTKKQNFKDERPQCWNIESFAS